jgi:hypothetical protein
LRAEYWIIVARLAAQLDQLFPHGAWQHDNPRLAALAEHSDLATASAALRIAPAQAANLADP